VNITRRIGIHADVVKLGFIRILGDIEDALGFPALLPGKLDAGNVISRQQDSRSKLVVEK